MQSDFARTIANLIIWSPFLIGVLTSTAIWMKGAEPRAIAIAGIASVSLLLVPFVFSLFGSALLVRFSRSIVPAVRPAFRFYQAFRRMRVLGQCRFVVRWTLRLCAVYVISIGPAAVAVDQGYLPKQSWHRFYDEPRSRLAPPSVDRLATQYEGFCRDSFVRLRGTVEKTNDGKTE